MGGDAMRIVGIHFQFTRPRARIDRCVYPRTPRTVEIDCSAATGLASVEFAPNRRATLRIPPSVSPAPPPGWTAAPTQHPPGRQGPPPRPPRVGPGGNPPPPAAPP